LLALELLDRTQQIFAVAGLRVGVTSGLPSLGVGQGCFGHEGLHPSRVGLLVEELHLFGEHRGFGAQALQAVGDVDQATLEQRAGHIGQSKGRPRRQAGGFR
jgi:hypothetical protein